MDCLRCGGRKCDGVAGGGSVSAQPRIGKVHRDAVAAAERDLELWAISFLYRRVSGRDGGGCSRHGSGREDVGPFATPVAVGGLYAEVVVGAWVQVGCRGGGAGSSMGDVGPRVVRVFLVLDSIPVDWRAVVGWCRPLYGQALAGGRRRVGLSGWSGLDGSYVMATELSGQLLAPSGLVPLT